MSTFVSLINWTDEGVKAFKDTVDRAETAQQLAAKYGGSFEVYWTVGPYDLVAVSTFPDDESATAFLLMLSSQGNLRSTTMPARGADEMRSVIAKTG
jgi:uncharacterized protein with GYD domain